MDRRDFLKNFSIVSSGIAVAKLPDLIPSPVVVDNIYFAFRDEPLTVKAIDIKKTSMLYPSVLIYHMDTAYHYHDLTAFACELFEQKDTYGDYELRYYDLRIFGKALFEHSKSEITSYGLYKNKLRCLSLEVEL